MSTNPAAGEIIWKTDLSSWRTEYKQYWPIVPTDAIVVPGTDTLLVADGYGSSFVHMFDKHTGAYLGTGCCCTVDLWSASQSALGSRESLPCAARVAGG